jgi:FkbM family methyltransferase
VDRAFGPGWHATPDEIVLQTTYCDQQVLTFFDSSNNCVLREAIAQLPAGGTFVDVGANVGYFSLLAAKAVGDNGRCIAFEPSSREFAFLLANRQRNNADNIVAINSALFDSTACIRLSISPQHHGLNTVAVPDSGRFSPCRYELSAAMAGDLLIEPLLRTDQVDLMKIDVEGAELRVLKGMSSLLQRRVVAKFCIEITPTFLEAFGDSADSLIEFMHSFGYRATVRLNSWQWDELFVRA